MKVMLDEYNADSEEVWREEASYEISHRCNMMQLQDYSSFKTE